MHRSRRSLTAAFAALVIAIVIAPIALAAAPTVDDGEGVPVVHLEGRGHGHGVGMSQWGAFTLASDGAGAADILARFYPGTAIGTATGEVVVGLVERPTIAVSMAAGGELRSARGGAQAPGFPIPVAPGEVVQILHDGSGYRVIRGGVRPLAAGEAVSFRAAAEDDCLVLCGPAEPGPGQPAPPDDPEDDDPEPGPTEPQGPCLLCTTTTTAPPGDGGGGGGGGDGQAPKTPIPSTTSPPPTTTTTTAPPRDAPRSPTPIWAVPVEGSTVTSHDRGRTYRGIFEMLGQPGAVRLRNHVDIEHYLMGMAEVPGHWPAAAVQAQAVAARTYALRAMSGGEICDSESCQVYVGISHESAGQRAAVEATRGWVVTYGGRLAATFYSASGGGHSATVAEGFGSDYDVPYLQAHAYETDNPKPWSADVALTDVAQRLQYPGTISAVEITSIGPSGRAVAMVLDGDAGPMAVDPQDFRRRLGLQSTLFTATVSVAAEAPPPPPEADTTAIADVDSVGGDGDGQFEALFVTPDAGADVAIGAVTQGTTTSRRAAPPAIALVAVMAGVLVTGGWRALAHGSSVTADGLAGTILGAPANRVRDQIAATMGVWPPRLPAIRVPAIRIPMARIPGLRRPENQAEPPDLDPDV